MGSRIDFVDGLNNDAFVNSKQPMMGTGLPLARQNSVFSLTFDEFQNSWGGGIGKDFGSMNMDELLKSIWTAEESHSIMGNNNPNINNMHTGNNGNTVINNGGLSVCVGGEGGGGFIGGSLQRQGSITLPRTISQKKVDDVWKELMKEDDIGNGVGNDGTRGIPQRQQTLGEMTLEDFLLRAGVVREETQTQPVENVNNFNGTFYGFGTSAGLGTASNGFGANQSRDLSGNGTEMRLDLLTTQAQPLQMQQPQQLIQKPQRPFPKQTNIAFSNAVDRSQPATQVNKNLKNYIMNGNNLTNIRCSLHLLR